VNTKELFDPARRSKAVYVWLLLLFILIASEILASQVQRDFGQVDVRNTNFENESGIQIRAKLLKPEGVSKEKPAPGVVYIHGYQNNRETSDAYVIEMARRGFVVLAIDAIGRGNSENPDDIHDPQFDPTFGGQASFDYLKSLPYVNSDSVGLMGHSLGAEMVYSIALKDETVKALVISGFAYGIDSTLNRPQNMLMIFGEYDEYRERMTGVTDVRKEWMSSPQSMAAIGRDDLELGVTYGDFTDGSARQVVLLPVIHLKESHSKEGVAAAVAWMKEVLEPDPEFWIDVDNQIWEIKEFATLIAMFSGLFSVLPVGLILLSSKYFVKLQGEITEKYSCTPKNLIRHAVVNGILMLLYLPLIFSLFGLHVYVFPIDKIFPMMMVNGTVWWFLWVNIFGFFIFRRWFRRNQKKNGLNWSDLGISYLKNKFGLDWKAIGKTALLGIILFVYTYLVEHILEAIFIVDYRFIFPFASDLTPYRFGMWLLYFPFLLLGFIQMGLFLHGQIKLPRKKFWFSTFLSWSQVNTIVMITPLVLFLLCQYLPIFLGGVVPFVGPGGMLASFTMNLFHIIGVLILIIPIQTWFFQLTGRPYLGAILNAAIVAWMFTSSQVIAPIPV
jgi:pimeloyl-ACP methyl ester carboxylesterase